MDGNLPTRIGVAAGAVAALFATVFLLIVRQVSALGGSTGQEDAAERVALLGSVGFVVSILAFLLLARYVAGPPRSVTAAAEERLQTERAQTRSALSALAREKARIETFHRAGERLAAARDLPELAQIAVAELALASGAGRGALWAVEADDQRELVLEASVGIDPALLPGHLHRDGSPAGRAYSSREVVVVEAANGAELHLPLVVGGRVLGLMSLFRDDAHTFGAEERDTLLRLAEQASVALSNAVSFRSALRAARVNRAVLDASPDPVGLVALDGSLLASNAAMAELWAQYPVIDAPADAAQQAELDLDDRHYSRYAGPVDDESGERIGRLVVLRDITAERESERLKDEFFALVSHELRTPLTSIIGYLELVRDDDDELTADARRFLEVVDRNAKRLLRLVGDMLFVAQVEAGRLSLERATIDLEQVVADSVEAARPAAQRGGVRLRMVASAVGTIDGDRDRIGQLIDNLVSNALKFTAEQGEVVVSLRGDGAGSAIVAVADDGMGIPAGEQQHLFERFFRSSTAATHAVPGAGLGLAICKTIVEAHRGAITFESTEGVGTTVHVHLPLSGGDPG